jgi:tetratricopeptide (TPR) repeat protein
MSDKRITNELYSLIDSPRLEISPRVRKIVGMLFGFEAVKKPREIQKMYQIITKLQANYESYTSKEPYLVQYVQKAVADGDDSYLNEMIDLVEDIYEKPFIKYSLESDQIKHYQYLNISSFDDKAKAKRAIEYQKMLIDSINRDGYTPIEISKALRINSDGESFFNQGELAKALNCFKDALAVHPVCDVALSNMGCLGFKTNQLVDAEHFFVEALTVNPSNLIALENLWEIYKKQGARGEILPFLHIANELITDFDAICFLLKESDYD